MLRRSECRKTHPSTLPRDLANADPPARCGYRPGFSDPPCCLLGTHRRGSRSARRAGRGRKSTRPGANGVVELTPFEFNDRLADLVPPPRKHRHRYHGVFAPNHKLRRTVTALAIGNIGKRGHATG
jgi:hypothetical protein